ncbi:hypothetical protein P6U16_04820 [Rhizobium sp. 32-5/1]|uniref:ATP-dependent Clp protease proteolytic subunit n=1 Tax=Rhizobium sp. 32-5/1 TaxID=3019602 RepID=UPI00240D5DCF|nr:ATP-dependent Clp protease proteolytic subunit [Rhizobium sp. 32-5/1]WEZ84044.1 hypothetical protein P6U16_04820 [Rhizobium sp. 32-5/1]
MRLQTAGHRIKTYFLTADDGALMRHAFHILLAASVVFVVIDWRELGLEASTTPAYDPTQPATDPILPPALTEGEPDASPAEITSSPETLKQAIRFELRPGGVLSADGAIDAGAAARFATEIEARGEYVKTVQLNSPGGSVTDALAMSKLIREKQIGTLVAKGGLCASSCPIVLSGGATRTVEADAVVGVHQVFNGSRDKLSPEVAMSQAQSTTADVSRHLEQMGIKSGLWLHALETPPDRLYYLTQKEMAEFALTTEAAPVASAETK